MRFDIAREIADAVLYEGYLLYPYRASSTKNQFRWQFGVVAPRVYSESGGCEPWWMQAECLIEPQESPVVHVKLRFLQIQGEQGIEREADFPGLSAGGELAAPLEFPGESPVSAVVRVTGEPVGQFQKLRVRVENVTAWPEHEGADRAAAVQRSLVGTHLLLGVTGGSFVSLIDPPPEAKAAAAACENVNTWPVMVGRQDERDLMLAAPIILYDYPAVAPESAGSFFDGTEIDELLTLRVMTLTDEEKREARETDALARDIIERSDSIPPEVFEKLHGAIRSMKAVAKGTRVRLLPRRRADAMDMFLAGRTARIERVERDVDGGTCVAVVLDDEAGAELQHSYGRFFYFHPDELEIV